MRDPLNHPTMRFEAILGDANETTLEVILDLDLDWLPVFDGKVRVLLTADDAAKLLDRGMEVRLVKSYPIRPIDPALVMDDETALAWLEKESRGVPRAANS